MSAADLVTRLAQAGVDPALLAEVAEELFSGEIERRALANRRSNERERKARSRDGTGRHVTGADRRGLGSPIEELLTPPDEAFIDEAIASSPVRQPIAEAIGIWNESAAAAGWPQVQSMSANRNKLLAARLREGGIAGWRRAIARARASPYLAGADPPSWFTFPWLIKSENYLKVSEGNYDRRSNTMGRNQPSSDGLSPTTRAALKVFGSSDPGEQHRVPQ